MYFLTVSQHFPHLHLSPYRRERAEIPAEWRETDSNRQEKTFSLGSVSITLNSLRIIQPRPGTGDRQRAPVTSLQGHGSFSASLIEPCTRCAGWDLPSGATLSSFLPLINSILFLFYCRQPSEYLY